MSDFWGFTTSSIATALSLAGHALLLAGTFFLGWVWHQMLRQRTEGLDGDGSMGTPVTDGGRSQRPAPL